jgi:hypothetical protein
MIVENKLALISSLATFYKSTLTDIFYYVYTNCFIVKVEKTTVIYTHVSTEHLQQINSPFDDL